LKIKSENSHGGQFNQPQKTQTTPLSNLNFQTEILMTGSNRNLGPGL